MSEFDSEFGKSASDPTYVGMVIKIFAFYHKILACPPSVLALPRILVYVSFVRRTHVVSHVCTKIIVI